MQTALADDSVTEIHVIQDMAFTDSIDSSKVIEVEPDVTLTVGGVSNDRIRYDCK